MVVIGQSVGEECFRYLFVLDPSIVERLRDYSGYQRQTHRFILAFVEWLRQYFIQRQLPRRFNIDIVCNIIRLCWVSFAITQILTSIQVNHVQLWRHNHKWVHLQLLKQKPAHLSNYKSLIICVHPMENAGMLSLRKLIGYYLWSSCY